MAGVRRDVLRASYHHYRDSRGAKGEALNPLRRTSDGGRH